MEAVGQATSEGGAAAPLEGGLGLTPDPGVAARVLEDVGGQDVAGLAVDAVPIHEEGCRGRCPGRLGSAAPSVVSTPRPDYSGEGFASSCRFRISSDRRGLTGTPAFSASLASRAASSGAPSASRPRPGCCGRHRSGDRREGRPGTRARRPGASPSGSRRCPGPGERERRPRPIRLPPPLQVVQSRLEPLNLLPARRGPRPGRTQHGTLGKNMLFDVALAVEERSASRTSLISRSSLFRSSAFSSFESAGAQRKASRQST